MDKRVVVAPTVGYLLVVVVMVLLLLLLLRRAAGDPMVVVELHRCRSLPIVLRQLHEVRHARTQAAIVGVVCSGQKAYIKGQVYLLRPFILSSSGTRRNNIQALIMILKNDYGASVLRLDPRSGLGICH
jgi:hypothetical protein